MALSKLSLLTRFATGAMEQQDKINAAKQQQADKNKDTMLAFSKEAYKADLNRYERLKEMQDTIFATGSDSLATTMAGQYGVKAGKGKEQLTASISERLAADPAYKEKLAAAYGNVTKPNPKDYFEGDKFDDIVRQRINSQDGITRLLFGSKQGPHMLTTEQLKAKEAQLLDRGGKAPDFTGGLTEQLSKLQLAGKTEIPGGDVDLTKAGDRGKLFVYATEVKGLDKKAADKWVESIVDDGKSDKWKVHFETTTEGNITTEKPVQYRVVDGNYEEKEIGGRVKVTKPVGPTPKSTKQAAEDYLFSQSETKDETGTAINALMVSNPGSYFHLEGVIASRAHALSATNPEMDESQRIEKAYDELKKGITVVDGLPKVIAEKLPDAIRSLFQSGAFERPSGSAKEIIRETKDGRKAVFDTDTKQFIRWVD